VKAFVLVALVACSEPRVIQPSAAHPFDVQDSRSIDANVKAQRRLVPAEAYLRAYLTWFGGLAPIDIQHKGGGDLFGQWADYLAALGLPDYAHDFPRTSQSNTMMLATFGRLGEVLCVRAAEHDLHASAPLPSRVVFAFELKPHPSLNEFAAGFDVLHRTFLGYPADLAPKGRLGRFYSLYQQVAAAHPQSAHLSADETGWVAVCTALVIHPEAELY